MPESLSLEIVRPLFPRRPEDAHKGTFGHLLVLAGSPGFSGAARMACEAALRTGCGLVTLGLPDVLAHLSLALPAEVMTRLFDATAAGMLGRQAVDPAVRFASSKDAIVIGPGLSQHPETVHFVLDFVKQCPVRMVIDADALNALSVDMDLFHLVEQPCILTPHPGEMARLLGIPAREVQADRPAAARRLAELTKKVVALKGAQTLIAEPHGGLVVNPTGNSGMATGGSGDVLAGMLGSLLAQGLKPWDAARAGVFAHGLAGDLAAQRMTKRGMIATDIIASLPEVWRTLDPEA